MKDLLKILGLLGSGLVGALPGLILAGLVWLPLRGWLFSMIPPDVQWAFWAKLATCIALFSTIGGSLPIWLAILGGVLGLKFAAELID